MHFKRKNDGPIDHEIHFSAGKPLLTLLFDKRTIPSFDAEIPVLDNRIATLSTQGEILESTSILELLQSAPGFDIQKVSEKKLGAGSISIYSMRTLLNGSILKRKHRFTPGII